MQTRNETHDRQNAMNITGEIVWNKNNYKNSGKDDPIPWLITPTPSDPPGVSHMFCFPFSFRWNNINGSVMVRCKDGWLADPAQQDKPGKSEASCCTQESEGDRFRSMSRELMSKIGWWILSTKFWVFWVSRWWLKGGVPSKYHAFVVKNDLQHIWVVVSQVSNMFFHVHPGFVGWDGPIWRYNIFQMGWGKTTN